MSKRSSNVVALRRGPVLGELIHSAVRVAIEAALDEELQQALGAETYARVMSRIGYRNGTRPRTISGSTGPLSLSVPRGRLFTGGGEREWQSRMLPRYERRLPEVNEAIAAAYLSGANTRKLKLALKPMLKDAPLSKSSVSRVVQTLKGALDEWRKRSLKELEVVYLYLDAFAMRVRVAGKVSSVPVLAAVAVLADGTKQLVSLEMCGSESHAAWRGFLDDLVERGLRAPLLCIVDGCAGLRRALGEVWAKSAVQRCVVHKLRNIQRKAPKHALEEITADFHEIVYAKNEKEARAAHAAFEEKWKRSCPGVVASLHDGGEELFTYFRFPRSQWKTIRTTNVIERLNEEFRRRVKTQGSLPAEDAALVLLFSLIASGQVRLRKLDGFDKIAAMLTTKIRDAV